MTTPNDRDVLTMDGWPLGVNNRLRETEEGQTTQHRRKPNTSLFLREAVNVDLTKLGHPLRRKGYKKIHSGYTHSLWSTKGFSWGLCVQNGQLKKVFESGYTEDLKEVAPYKHMSYVEVNGVVHWSNGEDKGRVDDVGVIHWGITTPSKVKASVKEGSLYPGEYKLSAVWVDEFGEEYGASTHVIVALLEGNGIEITTPSSWPDSAVVYRVFMSQPNGETLYHIRDSEEQETYTVSNSVVGTGRELETTDLKQVPAGNILRYFNGRIYIAHRNTVVFTEPLRYGLTRPSQGIYMFSSDVILLEVSEDGIYVGTKKGVVFIAGENPYDVQQRTVLRHAPVLRANTTVPGEFLGASQEEVPVWWGVDGAMVAGLPGGEVRQLSKDRIATPSFQSGAMLYREQEGMAQVVSALGRGGETSGMAATDTVVASVRQNTKQINT